MVRSPPRAIYDRAVRLCLMALRCLIAEQGSGPGPADEAATDFISSRSLSAQHVFGGPPTPLPRKAICSTRRNRTGGQAAACVVIYVVVVCMYGMYVRHSSPACGWCPTPLLRARISFTRYSHSFSHFLSPFPHRCARRP